MIKTEFIFSGFGFASLIFVIASFYLKDLKGAISAGMGVILGVITLTLIFTQDIASKSNEELAMERIAILEKAKDSTDPTIIAIADEIKEEVAKEQAAKEQARVEREKRDKFLEENPKLPMILLMGMLACLGFLAWGLRD